jgi:hypothetical protein
MKHLCSEQHSDCLPAVPSAQPMQAGGQVMIFVLMVLLLLSFVLIWNFDIHNVIHLKLRSQNAADASALAAARWQGITLNVIGDLNIMQAVALSDPDTGRGAQTAAQIADIQSRLCFAGPLIGLMASQQAAKNNGIYVNELFSARLKDHAQSVLSDYQSVFAEPYENCWEEYGQALLDIANAGIAAGPDNSAYYTDYSGGHFLLTMDFYDAVAGQEWCWFYWHALTLLQTYTDYQSWSPLPPQISETRPLNSEIFGLGLSTCDYVPGGTSTVAVLNQLREDRDLSAQVISNAVAYLAAKWFIFQPAKWSEWLVMKDSSFPVYPEKQIKLEYDYAGADAVTRIESTSERLMPSSPGKNITCTAAAKPFGYLSSGGTTIKPCASGIVLPAFHNLRLIPVDASSAPAGGAYDLSWREHIENHLVTYLDNGLPGLDASCWYCRQLTSWEDADFRQTGINWLSDTNNTCEHYLPGPGGSGGGTRRGH